MDVCVVCVYSVCVLCVGRGLATGWTPIQGILPTDWKSGQGPAKGCRAIIIIIIIIIIIYFESQSNHLLPNWEFSLFYSVLLGNCRNSTSLWLSGKLFNKRSLSSRSFSVHHSYVTEYLMQVNTSVQMWTILKCCGQILLSKRSKEESV
jgi:hypothetical protein